MLKREAEFSSHTAALPLPPRLLFGNRAPAERGCGASPHTPRPPPPGRGTAGAFPPPPLEFGWSRGLETHFHLKKKKPKTKNTQPRRGLLIGLNFAQQLFPSVRASALMTR